MRKMKSASFTIFLLSVVYLSLTQAEIPTRFRRSYDKILNSKNSGFGAKVGIPLVDDGNKKAFSTETRIAGTPKLGIPVTSDESSKAMLHADYSAPEVSKNDKDASDGDDKEHDGKNKESDYENIGDMGSGGEEDEEDMESGKDESGSGSAKDESGSGDKISGDTDEVAQSSGEVPDLSGDFPPTADQAFKLPKDVEMSPEEVDRKMLDKHKGYVKFAIRQRFKPEFKYKESPAYKILAGNVIHDVERALKATGVVKEVLFREAKNIGGPPYRSKVLVYLKLDHDVSPKKLKRIVNYGLINGMISVPGSFST